MVAAARDAMGKKVGEANCGPFVVERVGLKAGEFSFRLR
jgi:hypothetical protein